MATDRIRTTISLDPDVYEIFKRMAEAGGMSVSRCMGEWLSDTSEGAQLVALKMQEARQSPMTVMREFQALALGFQDQVNQTMDDIRQRGRSAKAESAASASPAARSGRSAPPSSNTGVKSPPSRKRAS